MKGSSYLAEIPDTRARARPLGPDDDGWWGMTVQINLTGGDQDALESKRVTRQFMTRLTAAIKMKPYGRPRVRKFGVVAAWATAIGQRTRWRALVKLFGEGVLYGISAVQLIYTSSVTWHSGGRGRPREGYLDIFTCLACDPDGIAEMIEAAIRVVEESFGGKATLAAPITHRGVAA